MQTTRAPLTRATRLRGAGSIGGLFITLLLAACTAAPGWAPAPTAEDPQPTPALPTAESPTSGPEGLATAPPNCPATRPETAFHAPAPFPDVPPAAYRSAWYGTGDLFTMIALDGEVWPDLPTGPKGLDQKSFWWSTAFVEDQPAIVVSGERLDAPGSFRTEGPGTNASADFGRAMLIGIQIPDPGCWRLTGEYRGATLTYVVWAGPLPEG